MNKSKKYSLMLLSFVSICLITVAGLTIYIDPFFHYHIPHKSFKYLIDNQRYQNDGIMRHLEYDAMIIGTSMTENFKTSEFDKLFNVNSIKVPFSGASYKEINDNINRAIEYNKNIKYVIRGIDYSSFYTLPNFMKYESSFYPTYLTNDNIFDDVYYFFNKSVILEDTLSVFKTYNTKNEFKIDFDVIYNWNSLTQFNKETVLSTFTRPSKNIDKILPAKHEVNDFKENIDVNIVETIKNNPDIQFYYFLTPYSICWWDIINQENRLEKHLYGEQMIIESLIQYDNVHLFSFSQDFDITTNLSNYKDVAHYSEDINSYMLEKMFKEENKLTRNNYKNYLKEIYEFYSTYDYDSLYN